MPIEEWSPSPNFGSRNGRSIIAIVDHVTSGTAESALSWFQNPASKVSAHYLVTRSGRIIQLVKEGNSSYHAGIHNQTHWSLYDGTNPNNYTIGIEHEGDSDEPLTEDQYQSTLFLHRELTAKYGIPIDSEHIIGHYRIDSVNRPNCPGPAFPWDRLFKDLKGNDNVLDKAVLLFTKDDFWAGSDVAAKNDCAVFVRHVGNTVPADAWNAKQLIVVGGASTGHPNEVLLSGNSKYDTAEAVAKYLV